MDLATSTSTNHSASSPPFSLPPLPSELILHILTFLDIPDLLSASRASHLLRQLCLDPLLHSYRLHRASFTIERYIPLRPSLAELIAHRIYITRTTLAARNLGRNLIKIKLNRQLLARPSAESLVQSGVLPGECYGYGRRREGFGTVTIAPALVETKRRIEKERVKDLLRGWVDEWRKRGSEKALVMRDGDEEMEYQRPDVRRMARRFAREGREQQPRWGAMAKKRGVEAPTRAKVLGLRRFWERIGREGASV